MITGSASAGWPDELQPSVPLMNVKTLTERTGAYLETLSVRQNIYMRTITRLGNHSVGQANAITELHDVIARHRATLPNDFLKEVLDTLSKWMRSTNLMAEVMQEAQESTDQEEARLAGWLAAHPGGGTT